jgi:hypothetical protein
VAGGSDFQVHRPSSPHFSATGLRGPEWKGGEEWSACTFAHSASTCAKGATCEAFPNGIPLEALVENKHMNPFPGDHDIQFDLDPNLAPTLRATFEKTFGGVYRGRSRKAV